MAFSFLQRLLGSQGKTGAESRRFGNYQIVKIIHEGEKAFVYQAREGSGDGLFVVKAYKPSYDRTARRMRKRYHLRTEGEIGLSLNAAANVPEADYPIVRTVAHGRQFGSVGGVYYLVQEYIDGSNLKHMVGCADPLLRARRLDVARAVARGLAIIHDRGMIHRDICTDNILVRRDGRVSLIDLGFAAPAGLRFEEKSGTLSYMSPEQFLARPLHPASDLYSFGVVLYELFTGRLPFISTYSSSNPSQLMRRTSDLAQQHQRLKPPAPSTLTTDLPEGMEALILRCLEKTPEKRPPAARQVLTALLEMRELDPAPGAPAAGTRA